MAYERINPKVRLRNDIVPPSWMIVVFGDRSFSYRWKPILQNDNLRASDTLLVMVNDREIEVHNSYFDFV